MSHARRQLQRSHLVRSSTAYALSNGLNGAVPFLLIPVLTRYLSPEDFGLVAMYLLAVSLAVPVVGLCTDGAIGRRFFDREQIDFPNYVTNCFYVLLATAGLAWLLSVAFAEWVAAALAIPTAWIWTIVLAAVARYVLSTVLVLWQMQHRPVPYALYSLAHTAGALLLSVLLIVVFRYGWEGRVLGELASLFVLAIVGTWILKRDGWIQHGIDRAHLTHAVKFGGGLVPHVYGGLLIVATDRFLLTNLLGVGETGLYMVAVQIALPITILEHSFNQAWAPWLFGVLKRNDPVELRRARKIRYVYNVAIIGIALLLVAAAPWFLGFFVGPEFRGAAEFVFWLALANAFGGMYKMVVNQIYYANKTHWLAAITFATGLLNVGLTYGLILKNGAVGAAQATAISLLLSYLFTAWLSARVARVPAGAAPA